MGSKDRPTMADVAARAGVSLSTVSLAYSGAGPVADDTKARIGRAASELGYTGPSPVAKSLRSGRSHLVGFLLPDGISRPFQDPFTLGVLDGVMARLGDLGLGVLLIPTSTGWKAEGPLLEAFPMDAAIVTRPRDHDDPCLDILKRRGIPAVVIGGSAQKGMGNVAIDDEKVTAELIRHLMDLGHTRIGTVTLPFDTPKETCVVVPSAATKPSWTPTRNRLNSFMGAGIEPCVIIEAPAPLIEEGTAAGRLAFNHPSKPTALVCQSDLLAAGVILAARELDLDVPSDISVTGFDGPDLPWLSPHVLTSVTQDARHTGELAAEQVRVLVTGKTPTPVNLSLEIRIGTTTAPPPKR